MSGGGLRRSVGSHRVPGICLSLLGFLLLFAGIMMVAMGQTIHSSNYKEVRIGGGITLVLGLGITTGGFVYQYIVHRDWKRRRLARLERKQAARNEIISSRAQIYMEEPGTSSRDLRGATSGSMVNLGIQEDDEGAEQWTYDPYAGAVTIDDETGYRHRYYDNNNEDASFHGGYYARYQDNNNDDDDDDSYNSTYRAPSTMSTMLGNSTHNLDIFTVTANPTPSLTPDIIIHRNDVRPASVSPTPPEVIDELTDTDDEDYDDSRSNSTRPNSSRPNSSRPPSGLSVNHLVTQAYSPSLMRHSLIDIQQQLAEEREEAEKETNKRGPNNIDINKTQDEGIHVVPLNRKPRKLNKQTEKHSTDSGICEPLEVDLTIPVIKRKQRKKFKPQTQSQDTLGHDTTDTLNTSASSLNSTNELSKSNSINTKTTPENALDSRTPRDVVLNVTTPRSRHNSRSPNRPSGLVNGHTLDYSEPDRKRTPSPKGKATKGSVIKSSKNIPQEKRIQRKISNEESDNWDSESFSDGLNNSLSDSSRSARGAFLKGMKSPRNKEQVALGFQDQRLQDFAIVTKTSLSNKRSAQPAYQTNRSVVREYKEGETSDWDTDDVSEAASGLPTYRQPAGLPTGGDETSASRCS